MSDDRFGDLARTALLPVMEEALEPPDWEAIPKPLSGLSRDRTGWLVAAAAAVVVLGLGAVLALAARGGGDPATPTVVTTTPAEPDLRSLLELPAVQGTALAFLEAGWTPGRGAPLVGDALRSYQSEGFGGATDQEVAMVVARQALAGDEEALAILEAHPDVVEPYLFVRIDDPTVDLSAAVEALRGFDETVAVWTVLGGDPPSADLSGDAAALQTWWRGRVFAEASGGLGLVSDAELRAVALDYVNQTGRTDVTVEQLRRSVESWCRGNPGDLLVPPDFVAQARRVACIEASNPRWRPAALDESPRFDPNALAGMRLEIAVPGDRPEGCCPEPIEPVEDLTREEEAALRLAYFRLAQDMDAPRPYLATAVGRRDGDLLGVIRFPGIEEACLVTIGDGRSEWNCVAGRGPHISWRNQDGTLYVTVWLLPDAATWAEALVLRDDWARAPGTTVLGGMAVFDIPMQVDGRLLSTFTIEGKDAAGDVVVGADLDGDIDRGS